MTPDEQYAMVDTAAKALAEHFDSVQILCSFSGGAGEGTRSVYNGRGNWFARQGMCHDFIQRDQADEISNQIASKLNPEDEQ